MAQSPGGRHRLDTERHWDQLCIAAMTIGTAALAAVIILYNPNTIAAGTKTTTDVIRASMVGASAVAYAFLIIQGIRTIFLDERISGVNRDRQKNVHSASTFGMLGTMLLLIVAMVLMEITLSTFLPWLEESKQSKVYQERGEPGTSQPETETHNDKVECPPAEPTNHDPKVMPQNETYGQEDVDQHHSP